jgi:serine/threonine protein kinase
MESNMKFAGIPFEKVCQIGLQLFYQMEILHSLGYVHGDLKLQNINYNSALNRYSITDFTQVIKVPSRNSVPVG